MNCTVSGEGRRVCFIVLYLERRVFMNCTESGEGRRVCMNCYVSGEESVHELYYIWRGEESVHELFCIWRGECA